MTKKKHIDNNENDIHNGKAICDKMGFLLIWWFKIKFFSLKSGCNFLLFFFNQISYFTLSVSLTSVALLLMLLKFIHVLTEQN